MSLPCYVCYSYSVSLSIETGMSATLSSAPRLSAQSTLYPAPAPLSLRLNFKTRGGWSLCLTYLLPDLSSYLHAYIPTIQIRSPARSYSSPT